MKNNQIEAHAKRKMKSKYLSRSDDDIVDGDEDELHKEADESHHHESDRRTERHLREFCNSKYYHPGFIKVFYFLFFYFFIFFAWIRTKIHKKELLKS